MSGEFDYFERNQIEIRIPASILRDKTGGNADYYEMSLPLFDDPDLTDDNLHKRAFRLHNGGLRL